jgi:hypothetical protein
MENVAENASKIRTVLREQGSLNLWEIRAILNGTRDGAIRALQWLAARSEIVCSLLDQEFCVSRAGQADPKGPGA